MKTKKALRTIALLVSILTLACAPTYAYAYTLPVCTLHFPEVVSYEYQPDPFIIQPGGQEYLFNYADELGGSYAVPANNPPFFIVDCNTLAPYLTEIYMTSPVYTLVYSTVVTTAGTLINIPANSYDRNFIIRITPIGGQPLYVSDYTYGYYY